MPTKKKRAEFKLNGAAISLRGIKQLAEADLAKDYIAGKEAHRILDVSLTTLRR